MPGHEFMGAWKMANILFHVWVIWLKPVIRMWKGTQCWSENSQASADFVLKLAQHPNIFFLSSYRSKVSISIFLKILAWWLLLIDVTLQPQSKSEIKAWHTCPRQWSCKQKLKEESELLAKSSILKKWDELMPTTHFPHAASVSSCLLHCSLFTGGLAHKEHCIVFVGPCGVSWVQRIPVKKAFAI